MTSKQALFEIYKQAKSHRRTTKQIIENKQQYEQIWKDLDILEIIKNKNVAISIIPICKNAYDYSMKTIGFEGLTDKEFKLIKEWLEND